MKASLYHYQIIWLFCETKLLNKWIFYEWTVCWYRRKSIIATEWESRSQVPSRDTGLRWQPGQGTRGDQCQWTKNPEKVFSNRLESILGIEWVCRVSASLTCPQSLNVKLYVCTAHRVMACNADYWLLRGDINILMKKESRQSSSIAMNEYWRQGKRSFTFNIL